MNNLGKTLILLVTGALAGSAGTYLYLKKNYDDKMNKECHSMAEYYDKYYSDRIETLENRIIELEIKDKYGIDLAKKEETTDEEAPEDVTTSKPAKKRAKKQTLEPVASAEYEDIVKTNYNAISEAHHMEPEVEKPVTRKKTVKKKTTEESPKGPVIIDFDQYTHDRRFEKRIITYLDSEEMFLDGVTNEPIENAEELVGTECTNLDFSEDGQSVYVRNESIGTDFEVVINVTDSYKEFCES